MVALAYNQPLPILWPTQFMFRSRQNTYNRKVINRFVDNDLIGFTHKDRVIPREAVEILTKLSKSVITKYHREKGFGEYLYNRKKGLNCLHFSVDEVNMMIRLFKHNTSRLSKRYQQLERSKLLWYEFLNRIIWRIDAMEEWRGQMLDRMNKIERRIDDLEEKK